MNATFFRPIATTASLFLICQVLQSSNALAAPPSNDELQRQVQQLQSQVQMLEQRTAATASVSRGAVAPSPSIEVQLTELSAKVASILQVLQITNQGVVLRSDRGLTLLAGNQLSLESRQKITIESDGHTTIRSSGTSEILGDRVVLNNGSRPVAFQGGQTSGSANQHIISNGSPTVLVP